MFVSNVDEALESVRHPKYSGASLAVNVISAMLHM